MLKVLVLVMQYYKSIGIGIAILFNNLTILVFAIFLQAVLVYFLKVLLTTLLPWQR